MILQNFVMTHGMDHDSHESFRSSEAISVVRDSFFQWGLGRSVDSVPLFFSTAWLQIIFNILNQRSGFSLIQPFMGLLGPRLL